MPKVLVIDDDRITLRVIEVALKQLNYTVVTASSGEEGLKLISVSHPDILVTDKNMPGIDGFEVTRRLRRDPDFAHIPVLVLTGESELEDKLAAFEAGADDYLSKPFESAELAARLTALMRRTEAMKLAQTQGLEPKHQAKLIAVHSLRGGIGCTSLATNLAVGLSNLWHAPTLLTDMVMVSGQIALMLNRPLKRTWADLAQFQADDIDSNSVRSIVTNYSDFMHYIASPGNPASAEQLNPEIIRLSMQALRGRYGYLVADLPHDFNVYTLDTTDAADLILLLLSPDMAGIRAAAIALDTYSKLNYPADKIKLVLNNTFAQGGIKIQKIESALHHPVELVIPFAPKHFVDGINRGTPILLNHPDDPVSTVIEDFAFRMSTETHQDIPPASPTEAWYRVNKRMKQEEKGSSWRVRSLLSMVA